MSHYQNAFQAGARCSILYAEKKKKKGKMGKQNCNFNTNKKIKPRITNNVTIAQLLQ